MQQFPSYELYRFLATEREREIQRIAREREIRRQPRQSTRQAGRSRLHAGSIPVTGSSRPHPQRSETIR